VSVAKPHPPRRVSEADSLASEDEQELEARASRSARMSVKLMNRLSWGYNSRAPPVIYPTGYRPASIPGSPVPIPRATEAVSVGDLLTPAPDAPADVDSPRGCCHRAHRVLTAIVDVIVAAPARAAASSAWLMSRLSCEETFPEPEKEAEFQESWRDENRDAVGPRRSVCSGAFSASRATCLTPRQATTLFLPCSRHSIHSETSSFRSDPSQFADDASAMYGAPHRGAAEPGRVHRLHRAHRRRRPLRRPADSHAEVRASQEVEIASS